MNPYKLTKLLSFTGSDKKSSFIHNNSTSLPDRIVANKIIFADIYTFPIDVGDYDWYKESIGSSIY